MEIHEHFGFLVDWSRKADKDLDGESISAKCYRRALIYKLTSWMS
jgi:hypothetical protein